MAKKRVIMGCSCLAVVIILVLVLDFFMGRNSRKTAFEKRIPEGYSEALAGQMSEYSGMVMRGSQVLRLYAEYPDKEFIVWHGGEFQELSEMLPDAGFDAGEEYLCVTIATDAVNCGFCFCEGR